MMKRFLAWALSGCLLFDMVPATAYAAQTSTEVVAQTETEETSTEGNSEVAETLEAGTEEVVTETVPKETEGQTSEESLIEESTAEETIPEVSEETMEEATDAAEETAVEETAAEEQSEETSAAEEETENAETEAATEEAAYEEELALEADSEAEVTELYLNTKTTIDLESGWENAKWFSFTATEAGYYRFCFSKMANGTGGYLSLYTDINGAYIDSAWISSQSGELRTDKLNAGDTIYLSGYSEGDEGDSLEIEIQKFATFALVKQEDGSYIAESDDYTISIKSETGYKWLKNTVAMEAKEGKELTEDYYVGYDYRKEGESYRYYSSCYLSGYQNYKKTGTVELESGSTYTLTYSLLDSSNNVIAVLDGDIAVTTKYTEEPIVIYDTKTTENSISMELERINSDISQCYYAPVNHSEEEKNTYIYEWKTYDFTGLQPGTEYYFQFTNSAGKVYYETKASTMASTTAVEYSMSIAEDGNGETGLQLKAEVSGYKGTESTAYLCYEFVDALGETRTGRVYRSLETDSESFTVETTVEAAFLADTVYDVTVWTEFAGGTKLGKEVKKVTAPSAKVSADAVAFTVVQNDTTASQADYTISITGAEGTVNAQLYYKAEGNKEAYSNESVTINGETTGSLSNMQSGLTYQFILFAGGVKKEQSVEFSGGNLKLLQAGEGETNAFDIVRTFKVDNTEERTSDLYLRLSYWNGSSYTFLGSAVTLTESENYQATVKTAEWGNKLHPDTDYYLKWELKESSDGSAVYTIYETVHTKKADIQFEETDNVYNQVSYSIVLNKESIKNFNNSDYYYVEGYIKKADALSYRGSHSIFLDESQGYKNTLTFTGLEADTDYQISWRMDGAEIAVTTLRTAQDTRAVEVTNIDARMHNAEIAYSCTGVNSSMSGGIFLYIREKGDENKWDRASWNSYNVSGTFYVYEYNDQELKEDTAYEYKIGFGDSYSATIGQLEKAITGEFRTAKDTRKLSGTGVTAGYTTASLGVLFSGNTYYSSSYLYPELFTAV